MKTMVNAIWEYGDDTVERMEGSSNKLMDFPTERLQATLERLGIL